jgi:hypothetical protein
MRLRKSWRSRSNVLTIGQIHKKGAWHHFAEKHPELTCQDCGREIPLAEIFDERNQPHSVV